MITIFTPIFNRADIVGSLYESLKLQSFKKFEWLIVNDGSTDNIDEVVDTFIAEDIVNIRYYVQPNGGKHRAINYGVQLAKGDLFFIVDSDDTIMPYALELLDKYYLQIADDTDFAGVAGYRCLSNGTKIYNSPNIHILDCTYFDFKYKYNQIGGIAEAYKTSVLKDFPFPDYANEKFCAESLVWNKIAVKMKLRIFNDKIYVWNYLPTGLTSGMLKNRRNSITYTLNNYSEILNYDIPIKYKIRNAINYWRFYFAGKSKYIFRVNYIWYIFIPIGYIIYLVDSYRLRHRL